jgi:hypothetical protein
MRKPILLAAILATTVTLPALSQTPVLKPEIRPFVGASIPTGTQRDFFGSSVVYGVQAALEVRETFHLLGTFAVAPATLKVAGGNEDKSLMMQYDVGMEFDLVRPLGESWLFKPFVGVGAGARSYFYDDQDLIDRTGLSGYGALGVEFQIARTAIRFEGRDNVFTFKSPLPFEKSRTRNDVGFSLGLAYHFR